MASAAAPLPTKEQGTFRSIVKCYDGRQYKKGLKAAETILKRFPHHGDTLAMKGLLLSSMGRKEEAFATVRRGLRNCLTSANCWHVMGVLHRGEREYIKAANCFRNALKHDPENQQILRDLSFVQLLLRDYHGFQETRKTLLLVKPTMRPHWMGYILANHLNRDFAPALQLMDKFESTLATDDTVSAFDRSELQLYKLQMMMEAGEWERAMQLVEQREGQMKDRLAALEAKAAVQLKLGRHRAAEETYRQLLLRNPDRLEYVRGWLQARGVPEWPAPGTELDAAVSERVLAALDALLPLLSERAALPRRLALDVAVGDEFVRRLDAYARDRLVRGIPSLFSDLAGLYRVPRKVAAMQALFESYVASLRAASTFPDGTAAGPAVLLWALALLAQHYDRVRALPQALTCIDEAIAHTPTVVELYLFKARVLKHMGDAEAAAAAAEEARAMDLADRYLNNHSVKCLLRAGKVEQAEATMNLFTRHDQFQSDLQVQWYEYEQGRAHQRAGALGKALRFYTAMTQHFEDFFDDQHDFFVYALRKTMMRALVDLMRTHDNIFAHKFYVRAAKRSIECYLELHRRAEAAERELPVPAGVDRAAYVARWRRERQVVLAHERAAAEAAAKEEAKRKGKPGRAKPTADPDGLFFLQDPEPLAAAQKLLDRLLHSAAGDAEVQLLAAEVYSRCNKPLRALRALTAAARLAPGDERVRTAAARLADQQAAYGRSGVVAEVLAEGLGALTAAATPSS